MGQKVRSGLQHWIFHASQHMTSFDDTGQGRKRHLLFPEWEFVCRGFLYIGDFQHWNPAAVLPAGLPVSHMLKQSLNSGRGSILTTLHPWHFLKELNEQQTRVHKDGSGLWNCSPACYQVKGYWPPLPHLGHPDFDVVLHGAWAAQTHSGNTLRPIVLHHSNHLHTLPWQNFEEL